MRLAIVGGGIAGLSAAFSLRSLVPEIEITVFEKSRGFAGRATTRRKNGASYDHGANYFYSSDARITDIIKNKLPTNELTVIAKPIFTFSADGKISVGQPSHDDADKWVYTSGISTLGKLLAAVHHGQPQHRWQTSFETRIASMQRSGDGTWKMESTNGETFSGFDAVLLTPPAPQIVDLLRASQVPDADKLMDKFASVNYKAQITVILAYGDALPTFDWYALLNVDREHPIAWLSAEDCKQGHVPAGQRMLIAQMAPSWSTANWDLANDLLIAKATAEVATLLGTKGIDPVWTDVQKWRFALPANALDMAAVSSLSEPNNLFFAGDFEYGRGRVTLAMQSGLDAAQRIVSKLQQQ